MLVVGVCGRTDDTSAPPPGRDALLGPEDAVDDQEPLAHQLFSPSPPAALLLHAHFPHNRHKKHITYLLLFIRFSHRRFPHFGARSLLTLGRGRGHGRETSYERTNGRCDGVVGDAGAFDLAHRLGWRFRGAHNTADRAAHSSAPAKERSDAFARHLRCSQRSDPSENQTFCSKLSFLPNR